LRLPGPALLAPSAPQLKERALIQLRQRIRNCVPRTLALDKDVAIRADSRILIKRAGWNLKPTGTRRRIRYWRPTPRAERGAVGRRGLADWRFIPLDQLGSGEKPEVLGANTETGDEGGTRRLPAARAVAQFKGPNSSSNLEAHATAEATAANRLLAGHFLVPLAPYNGLRLTCRPPWTNRTPTGGPLRSRGAREERRPSRRTEPHARRRPRAVRCSRLLDGTRYGLTGTLAARQHLAAELIEPLIFLDEVVRVPELGDVTL